MSGNVAVVGIINVITCNAFISRNTVLSCTCVLFIMFSKHNPNLLILDYTCSNLLYCDQKKII